MTNESGSKAAVGLKLLGHRILADQYAHINTIH